VPTGAAVRAGRIASRIVLSGSTGTRMEPAVGEQLGGGTALRSAAVRSSSAGQSAREQVILDGPSRERAAPKYRGRA
jgi:hypothetical protein